MDRSASTRLSREHRLDLAQTAGTLEALATDPSTDVPDYVRRAAARCRQRVEDVLASAAEPTPGGVERVIQVLDEHEQHVRDERNRGRQA